VPALAGADFFGADFTGEGFTILTADFEAVFTDFADFIFVSAFFTAVEAGFLDNLLMLFTFIPFGTFFSRRS
jgi:hypothetical protein